MTTDTQTYVDNILSVYNVATQRDITEGMYWYLNANGLAHEIMPDNPRAGAGIIAVLSPRLRWDKNVAYARLAVNLMGYGVDEIVASYIPVLKHSRRKALAIVHGAEVLDVIGNGPKTRAFFDNIANPFTSTEVTVDKHAFDIANNIRTPYKGMVITNKTYAAMAEAYQIAAGILGILPHQLQAITWVAWRRIVGAE